ncbi:MAG: hypothetical protein EKK48_29520 [Candidatus Melainabacteria bacterium]|nr:MAG: hypothetical protein EKK48_29520 [Candidatus Melainabacteria bacterium]
MTCQKHNGHDHKHSSSCGHQIIQHDDHTDFLHDGHLHHVHDDHIDEHTLSESSFNKTACTPDHDCEGHESGHTHGKDCGHEAVPHGDHVDYLVHGHLHSPCKDHCDDHGIIAA